jgi:signal transduction histidine kinase
MEFYFSYNKKMVIQALRYHFLARPEIRILIVLVNVFAILSAGLFFFRKVSPVAFLVSSLLWFILMISLWFILPGAVYKRASTFRDAFKINFGQYGVQIENERGRTEWNWNKFSTFLESPHFFHLYFDSKSFFLVPKSAVENQEELRKMLQLKIPKRK